MTNNDDSSGITRRGGTKSSVRPIAGRRATDTPVAGSANPGAPVDATKPVANERRAHGRIGRRITDAVLPLQKTPPVLIATADESLSRMLTFALEQMHLEFKELRTGSQTLSELSDMEVGEQPPVVVLDVDLPGMDGHAVLERIGVLRPDTFLILVLSSHADESMQVRSLLGGAVDHLAKPFNVRVLMAKVHRWVAMSARIATKP